MNILQYAQIIAIVVLWVIYIYGLFKVIRGRSANKWNIVLGFTFATLLLFHLTLNAYTIAPADWVQIMLTFGLVLATIQYAISAAKQAEASVKMAREMREQRRPIVVQKVVPAKSVPYKLAAEDITKSISSDYFEIHNEGYGPAIELEILLLDKEKRQLEKQRETFFPKVSESPLEFHPNGLTNHVNSTCYLLCRYRGVISSDEAQLWYETWLPFVPVKSQRGDRIIIQPKELKFSEAHKKESY